MMGARLLRAQYCIDACAIWCPDASYRTMHAKGARGDAALMHVMLGC